MRITDLKPNDDFRQQINDFTRWAIKRLGIESKPRIRISSDKASVEQHRTFGSTKPSGEIWVYSGNRNTADVMRTLCHELVHYRQFETGSAQSEMDQDHHLRIEDEANALAGRLMREYGKMHVDIYEGLNPETLKPGFQHEKQVGELKFVARAIPPSWTSREVSLEINVFYGGQKIAGVLFIPQGNSLQGNFLTVHKDFRRKGIATQMYRYARSLGNTIEPNLRDQKPEGRAVWQSFRDKGIDKEIMHEGRTGSLQHEVADSLPQAFSIPALSSNNPYDQYKFGVAIASARGRQQRLDDGIGDFKKADLDEVFADHEVVISFDPNIGEIIDDALRQIGVTGKKVRIGVEGSRESNDVQKQSPVSSFRGYPR
jgi:hypothetical protein